MLENSARNEEPLRFMLSAKTLGAGFWSSHFLGPGVILV